MEKLRTIWNNLTGDIISTHSMPDRVFKHILFISVDHSIFANELSLMKNDILKGINIEFGFEAIKDIRISTKRLDWSGRGQN
jgi:hypothetical protein